MKIFQEIPNLVTFPDRPGDAGKLAPGSELEPSRLYQTHEKFIQAARERGELHVELSPEET